MYLTPFNYRTGKRVPDLRVFKTFCTDFGFERNIDIFIQTRKQCEYNRLVNDNIQKSGQRYCDSLSSSDTVEFSRTMYELFWKIIAGVSRKNRKKNFNSNLKMNKLETLKTKRNYKRLVALLKIFKFSDSPQSFT